MIGGYIPIVESCSTTPNLFCPSDRFLQTAIRVAVWVAVKRYRERSDAVAQIDEEAMMIRRKSTRPFTVSSLKLYEDKGELVNPDVQRDLVWTKSQKQLLIDSLIKDYDIPKLYFREVDDSNEYEIIDGQQRLNAILGFMKDEFALPLDSDPFGDELVAGKIWSEMSTEFQIEFQSRSLDVVILSGYTDDERDEAFLRLQNGTPLKAPEKRRAISGNMRRVVEMLASHGVFQFCGFSDKHYAYQDVTAKALKMIMEGGPTSVTAQSLCRMYELHPHIQESDKAPSELRKSFSFLKRAFSQTTNPQLKKYAIVDLAVIASSLLQSYDLGNHCKAFGDAYNDFCDMRALNAEKPEDDQDPSLVAYANCARGDSLEYVVYRQDLLRRYFLEAMPYLVLKDNNRAFTQDQRLVIFRRSGGKCQECGTAIAEDEFEADHKIPWSKGGRTQIANGQALCIACNRMKGNALD